MQEIMVMLIMVLLMLVLAVQPLLMETEVV